MSNNLKGILWGLVATAGFSGAAVLVKFAIVDYPVLQILFIRQLVVFTSTLPGLAQSFPEGLVTRRPGIHLVRLCGTFAALALGIWAVGLLPLTTALTLSFAQVFVSALFALWFLGEWVGVHRISAVIMGFVGVLIVMRPSPEGLADINVLVPVGGAVGAAVALSCVRSLSQTESTSTLLVYQALGVGLVAAIPLFWIWVPPTPGGWALLIAIGVVATIAHWCGTQALRLGELSVIANVDYTKLIYGAIFGYILFAEIPDAPTIIGAAVIVAASAYIFHREAIRSKTRTTMPPQ